MGEIGKSIITIHHSIGKSVIKAKSEAQKNGFIKARERRNGVVTPLRHSLG